MVPEDLVVVAQVTGAYGLKGWIHLKPYSAEAEALLQSKVWWLNSLTSGAVSDVNVLQAKMHNAHVVATIEGVLDRDDAEALKGTVVYVRREHFPPLPPDEYYWVDLVGLRVENTQGQCLGKVTEVLDYGAHPILSVLPDPESAGVQQDARHAVLIPFVDVFIKDVDQTMKKITVDWDV